MTLLARRLARAPSRAKDLFAIVIPKALARSRYRAAGVCAVTLLGDAGGAWTVDLGAKKVALGASAEADCSLTMMAEQFEAMVAGKLQPGDLDPRATRASGDVRLLAILAMLIRP
jgi:hypothetical protein